MSVTRVSRTGGYSYRKIIGGLMIQLGSDRLVAERRADLLVAAYKSNSKDWSLDRVDELITAVEGQAPRRHHRTSQPKRKAPRQERGVRLYDLGELLAKDLERRGRSPQHYMQARTIGKAMRKIVPNCQLSRLGREELREMGARMQGRDVATATKVTALVYWRLMLRHAEDAGYWPDPPSRWERLLRCDRGKRSNTIRIADVGTIQTLYNSATSDMRACMLLALNCGFTQLDIGTLEWSHLVQGDVWRIERERHKTGIWGSWMLWPETVEAMRNCSWCSQKKRREGLVFRTGRGKPVCSVGESGRRLDRIYPEWGKLRKKTQLDVTFKILRKTGATMVAQVAGDEVAQRYLAHVALSMARLHYVAQTAEDFKPLDVALEKVRERIGLFEW